jgi:RNA polymerase sigma-70 factor (ECF subfamily)
MRDDRHPTGAATNEGTEEHALRSRLLAAVRRRCPAWLADDAEDIVQTAMIRVLEVRRRDGGSTSFGPSYLEKVAQNATIDAIRARFRRRETGFETEGGDVNEPGDPRPRNPETGIDVERAIRECLGNLIRTRRIAVACRLLGHTGPEAAALTGWSAKRLEHLTGRGLDDLRSCLAGKGIER